uniref:GAGA-binding transcriptional activator n=1 Tax=Pinus taeda TaxID=3352 RepID=H1ZN57_PINTA|nr:GAGA-binding transcriptional activator [Pinus taeda]
MDDEGRLDIRHWDTLEQSVKDHPGLKFMSVLAERDAAILERNTAFSEKKAAFAEKETAIFQRDVAYADRNTAILERDAAAAALNYARDGGWNGQRSLTCGTLSNAKILQVLAENPTFSAREYQTMRPINVAYPASVLETLPFEEAQKTAKRTSKKKDGEKESPSKRKSDVSEPKSLRQKKQRKPSGTTEEGLNGEVTVVKKEQKNLDVVINGIFLIFQLCLFLFALALEWLNNVTGGGNGGWQSACCTTSISMYPLPMNPNRRGARVAGRKMSGGAFRKLLERLGAEGFNLNYPIDLKSYWAKHGTNKFVTIR